MFAANEERALKLGEKLIAENITKGFVLTGETPATASAAPVTKEPEPAAESKVVEAGNEGADSKPAPKKKAAKKAK